MLKHRDDKQEKQRSFQEFACFRGERDMDQRTKFRALIAFAAGTAVVGAPPVRAQSDTPLSAAVSTPTAYLDTTAAGRRVELDLLKTTYSSGQIGGNNIKPGTAALIGDQQILVCPTATCTIRFTGQVQVEGGGKENNINICTQLDSKAMTNCTVQGQAIPAPQVLTATQVQVVKKGAHKVQGFAGTIRGAKVFFYLFAWDLYK